jgi:hypothetical protein
LRLLEEIIFSTRFKKKATEMKIVEEVAGFGKEIRNKYIFVRHKHPWVELRVFN